MDTIKRDYFNSLFWGSVVILMGIAVFYLAHDRSNPGVAFAVGSVFLIGGIALIAKARWWFNDLTGLMREGSKHDVWISLHNTGAGDSGSTSFVLKVFSSRTAPKASLSFEVDANSSLRKILESKEKAKATLLRRERSTGLVIIYVDEQMVLPSSDVRYFEQPRSRE